jgi:hypothetical protein
MEMLMCFSSFVCFHKTRRRRKKKKKKKMMDGNQVEILHKNKRLTEPNSEATRR